MIRRALLALLLLSPLPVSANDQSAFQLPQSPGNTDALAFLDGVWIGPASMTLPSGERRSFTQMERVGPMFGGTLRVMEGRGRNAEGKGFFGALTVFSPQHDGSIEMRSWAMGHQNSRTIQVLDGKGFVWEMKNGNNIMRYTAQVDRTSWNEIGEFITPDGKRTKFFEMALKRVGDTDWPAANPAFPTK